MRVIVTGASRGIGRAIALRFARDGAEVALLGRSVSESVLPGTLREVHDEICEAGWTPPHVVRADATDGEGFTSSIGEAVDLLGGRVDVLVNNASALVLDQHATSKQMDLLHSVNTRSTLLAIQGTRAAMRFSHNANVVTLSPPIRLGRLEWISDSPAYTVSKYGMTLATLGAASGTVRANTLWPRRLVATEATKRLEREGIVAWAFRDGRPASHVAEAVHRLVCRSSLNARMLLDDDVLGTHRKDASAPLDRYVEDD